MTDVFTKEKRSEIMSKIRSKWTKQEVLVHNYLKGHKIRHKMHPRMEGNPDIVLKDNKVAIFLHGCFWHKCPLHYRKPKSNVGFWTTKIKNNVCRDRKNVKILRNNKWKVIILWEHDLKAFDKILKIVI
jgi:DNA mismatch endonuclease (patch repair protein)